jgi:hypothetical protein
MKENIIIDPEIQQMRKEKVAEAKEKKLAAEREKERLKVSLHTYLIKFFRKSTPTNLWSRCKPNPKARFTTITPEICLK